MPFEVTVAILDENQQDLKYLGKAHNMCHTFHKNGPTFNISVQLVEKSCFIRSVCYSPYILYIVTAAMLDDRQENIQLWLNSGPVVCRREDFLNSLHWTDG